MNVNVNVITFDPSVSIVPSVIKQIRRLLCGFSIFLREKGKTDSTNPDFLDIEKELIIFINMVKKCSDKYGGNILTDGVSIMNNSQKGGTNQLLFLFLLVMFLSQLLSIAKAAGNIYPKDILALNGFGLIPPETLLRAMDPDGSCHTLAEAFVNRDLPKDSSALTGKRNQLYDKVRERFGEKEKKNKDMDGDTDEFAACEWFKSYKEYPKYYQATRARHLNFIPLKNYEEDLTKIFFDRYEVWVKENNLPDTGNHGIYLDLFTSVSTTGGNAFVVFVHRNPQISGSEAKVSDFGFAIMNLQHFVGFLSGQTDIPPPITPDKIFSKMMVAETSSWGRGNPDLKRLIGPPVKDPFSVVVKNHTDSSGATLRPIVAIQDHNPDNRYVHPDMLEDPKYSVVRVEKTSNLPLISNSGFLQGYMDAKSEFNTFYKMGQDYFAKWKEGSEYSDWSTTGLADLLQRSCDNPYLEEPFTLYPSVESYSNSSKYVRNYPDGTEVTDLDGLDGTEVTDLDGGRKSMHSRSHSPKRKYSVSRKKGKTRTSPKSYNISRVKRNRKTNKIKKGVYRMKSTNKRNLR
jgi:hypothetical protein